MVGSDLPYAGIAPPLSLSTGSALPAANDLSPARRIFIIGDRDQFAAVDDLASYAEEISASVEVIAGSDHFFHFREIVVTSLVAEHFEG